MKTNKGQMVILIGLLAVIAIVAALYFVMQWTNNGAMSQGTLMNKGRLVMTLTDAAAELGAVSKAEITVDSIMAHSITTGWITLSSTQKTYDLIELKNSGELVVVSDNQVEVGAYDQVRLDISKVVITDSEGVSEAKLPSNELKIMTDFNVNEDSTATLKFDFLLDESLHLTGNGKYILAPVIQLETREDTEVKLKTNNRAEISGGIITKRMKIGTDIEGNIGMDIKIPANVNLSIENNGKIKILTLPIKASSEGNVNVNVGMGSGSSGY